MWSFIIMIIIVGLKYFVKLSKITGFIYLLAVTLVFDFLTARGIIPKDNIIVIIIQFIAVLVAIIYGIKKFMQNLHEAKNKQYGIENPPQIKTTFHAIMIFYTVVIGLQWALWYNKAVFYSDIEGSFFDTLKTMLGGFVYERDFYVLLLLVFSIGWLILAIIWLIVNGKGVYHRIKEGNKKKPYISDSTTEFDERLKSKDKFE